MKKIANLKKVIVNSIVSFFALRKIRDVVISP